MEISTTAADGTRLVARRSGRGVPVILVHGSAGGLDSFDPVIPLLDDRFEPWVYARRGYPPSQGCQRRKTYADDVADLQAIITAAGGRAHVVGASYGGTIALHAAVTDTATIRSMAVFEPPLFAAGESMAPVLRTYRDLLDAGEVATATRLFAEKVARVPAPILAALAAGDGAQKNTVEDAAATAEAVGCLHDLQAMTADETDYRRWAGIEVPTLLMQGEQTWEPMPTTMDALAEALPKAVRVVLSGQSHFATHTAPEMFARMLNSFLSQHG
jgi:pimeloyl-ACP methyl ester carboxylesterase